MTSTVPSSCKAPSARNAASMPNERHRKRKKNTASTCLRCFSAPKRSVSYKSKTALISYSAGMMNDSELKIFSVTIGSSVGKPTSTPMTLRPLFATRTVM